MENPVPLRLRDLAVGERPQERLRRLGPRALSDAELLALLLRSGSRRQDVLGLAANLMREAGCLGGLLRWAEADFRRHRGIGPVKAAQLLTVLEVARRVLRQEVGENPELATPQAVVEHFRPLAAGLDIEKFWVVSLNRKNRALQTVEVTSGTATNSLAHPREVFREAIRQGATAVLCAHNHPSGDPAPSTADLRTTRQLREAAGILGIDLLDHLILGRPEADPLGRGYYSFREAGLL